MVPRRDGRSEEDHKERGRERDDRSDMSAPTDYVFVSSDVGEYSWDQNSTPVSLIKPKMRCTI